MTRRIRGVVLAVLLVPSLLAGPAAACAAAARRSHSRGFAAAPTSCASMPTSRQDGAPVTDLTAQDFEVLEDNVPQRVESFELIKPRPAGPQSERREPNTVAEAREMARGSGGASVRAVPRCVARADRRLVSRAGAATRLLTASIGQDDLVGVMTPEMSARNLTLARRTDDDRRHPEGQLVLGPARSARLARSARGGDQGLLSRRTRSRVSPRR